jgi:HEAT repeat protein
VYEPELIPYAIIAAALLTAGVAVIFTGVVAGTQRRALAIGLTAVLGLSVIACRLLFGLNPRSAFVVYLWLSAIQVLVLTHAWDYASSMLTGRQAKRLLPLFGVGASIGAIIGGMAVAPAAFRLGTENLLWIAFLLLAGSLPLLWLIPEPVKDLDETDESKNALIAFMARSGRGFQAVASSNLLRLMAFGLVALTITGTLIDLQLKFLLQETFERDRITAIYGLMSAGVGTGTLLLQLWASRVLFPRFGVSFAAMLHGGTLMIAAGGAALVGGLGMLVFAQALDDILQFSLQKPVEQVSLLPFPARVKSVALATLGGVLRPLSKASAGGIALALADSPRLLPMATIVAAGSAFAAYSRHRERYMKALEGALARHAVDFSEVSSTPLVVDKSTLDIIDRGLADEDATVVIFSTTLLEQLPAEDALPRLVKLLEHPQPEVRAESAAVFGRIDAPLDFAAGMSIARRITEEEVPYVLAALLDSVGRVGGIDPETLVRYLDHDDPDVQRAGLVALARLGWTEAEPRMQQMLRGSSEERVLAAQAVGDLELQTFMDDLAAVVDDAEARPAALDALARLGPDAVPILSSVLGRDDLPIPLRRTVITALAGIEGDEACEALIKLVEDAALGPAALHSLGRMRAAKLITPIDEMTLRPVLKDEMRRGLLMSAASTIIRTQAQGPGDSFVAAELAGLHQRSVYRVLKILALTYDPARISTISTALVSDNPARRSNALELLEGTVSGPSAMVVMPFLDIVAEGMPLHRVLEMLPNGRSVQKAPAEALLDEEDWWPRALALHQLGRDDEVSIPGHSMDEEPKESAMMPLIEKVMILKGSEFFRNFPGSDLAGIAALSEVVHVAKDEVVFRQGDDGDAFYMVVSGSIIISRGATKLATLGSREGFGEMSILDSEPRSASATAAEETTLLMLDRDSFDRAIEQNPVVARGVYRVLTERLRNTLAQVAAG